jgi:hypothetical protein
MHLPVTSSSVAGFSFFGRLAAPIGHNEATQVRLRYGSRVRRTRLRVTDCSMPRSFGYLLNGQFTE